MSKVMRIEDESVELLKLIRQEHKSICRLKGYRNIAEFKTEADFITEGLHGLLEAMKKEKEDLERSRSVLEGIDLSEYGNRKRK